MALEALARIDEGAYANLVLPSLLAGSGLSERDRGFATALVYGTTRMRRACDLLVDRFVLRPLDGPTRNALRLGAYQLHHLGTPPHAAVSATVAVAPPRSRGLVNAVLRRVAEVAVTWPNEATRLSYPDWVVDRLVTDLGEADAIAALEQMDEPAEVNVRGDGYVQDLASQWAAAAVGAQAGERVADVCAAPGGKATALATTGAVVVASDVDEDRVGLIAENVARVGGSSSPVAVAVADAARPPWRPGSFDRALVDAPCSGLGVLRRRADARWRVEPGDVDRLAGLQRRLLDATIPLLAAGGTLVYSVCTITEAETLGIDRWLAAEHPDLVPVGHLGAPWRSHGRGDLLLPHDAGTDGMFVLRLRT